MRARLRTVGSYGSTYRLFFGGRDWRLREKKTEIRKAVEQAIGKRPLRLIQTSLPKVDLIKLLETKVRIVGYLWDYLFLQTKIIMEIPIFAKLEISIFELQTIIKQNLANESGERWEGIVG